MTLELDTLTVTYGDTVAVDGVSLRVEQGEILALVGPSGCGKSTLLRTVAGLVAPRSGTIRWEGRDLAGVPTEQRSFGLMFQDHALFTHRDVGENVAFGLRMQGIDRAERERQVDRLLDLVGLVGFGGRSVASLSGGEAQRVALARAFAPEPELLLLDEPLASLDRALREELNEQLAALLRSLGQTAIYVTHDQHEAFAIADRVGVLRAGSLVREGRPAEVWSDPRTEFVARFVGHDTILELDGERYAVRADAIRLTTPDVSRRGRVVGCRFQGDRHRIEIEVDGEHYVAWQRDAVDVDAEVGIEIDHDRLARLDG